MANTDLRHLMQLKKLNSRKITHPLAKYNNLEQLVCVICTKVVKDEAVWSGHLQSRKHKENVLLLKSKASKTMSPSSSSSSSSSSLSSLPKKSKIQAPSETRSLGSTPNTKSQLPEDFFDNKNSTKPVSLNCKPKSILKGSESYQTQHILHTTKNISITSPTIKEDNTVLNSGKDDEPSSLNRKRKADSNLPEDFFDETEQEAKPAAEPVSDINVNAEEDSTSKLPEGFFDDPKKDAEARNVEYKDPKEKEWEMFQKMIEEETRVAETIQEEEDEESEMHKDLLELNKMKSCLSRVENLKNLICKEKQKKIELKKEKQGLGNSNGDISGDSDEDIDNIFDWRAKMA